MPAIRLGDYFSPDPAFAGVRVDRVAVVFRMPFVVVVVLPLLAAP